MNQRSIPYWLILLCLLVLGAGTTAVAQNDVTFQVNMKIKMMEGTFLPGSGDVVTLRGTFNGYANTDTMTDVNGDSIYTKTLSLPTDSTVSYKFFKTLRGGIDWEADPNRSYVILAGAQNVPVAYFDRDSVYNAPTINVPVTFQVKMGVKMAEGTFRPDSGDIVRVAGGFNGWGGSTDTLKDPDGDSTYTGTVMIAEGSAIQYKFLKTLRGGIDWENAIGNNRAYNVPVGGATIPAPFFDNDALISVPVSMSILWQVDMTTYETLGWFRPDLGDSVQVRGPAPNGWNGTWMDANLFQAGVYEVSIPFSGYSYDDVPHKFFIHFDSVSASERFPGFAGGNHDEYQYEHTANLGDGNAVHNVGAGGDQATALRYFASINPSGIIPAGDTVDVTFSVNMGPATRYSVPIDLANDTVKLGFIEGVWRASQAKIQGSFARYHVMSHSSPTDSIYTVTVTIIGPTTYGLMYRYQYVSPGTTYQVDQAGGLGGTYLYQSRYVQPLSVRSHAKASSATWPRTYSTPTDNWQHSSPFVAEVPPFDITNGVEEIPGVLPKAFTLSQNYPNPFNPSTRIRYTIPEASKVTLRVFNILGQQVASLVNQEQTAGNYVALFEANRFPSGVYFYQLEAGSFRQVKKMVLMK